jgi:LysR family glycine cleavage system transcriptional activator
LRVSLPPLQSLRAVEAAGRLGSFRAAALELHLTPSAISQQIRGVEGAIGATLFARTGRTVLLTRAGQLYCDEVRRLLRDLVDAARRARSLADARVLRLSTVDVLAYEFLIPRLPAFQARFPELELRIETTMRVVDLQRSELDAALRVRGSAGPGLSSQPIGRVVGTPVCSPKIARRIRSVADLTHEILIELRGPGENMWASLLKARGVAAPRLRTLSFEGYVETLTAAERGLGIAFGLFPMTSDWLRQGRLAVPFSWRYELPGGVYLVFRADDPRHALFMEVAAWLREQYATLAPLPDGRSVSNGRPQMRSKRAGPRARKLARNPQEQSASRNVTR